MILVIVGETGGTQEDIGSEGVRDEFSYREAIYHTGNQFTFSLFHFIFS